MHRDEVSRLLAERQIGTSVHFIPLHHMPRYRIGVPVRHAKSVIEAEVGAFARWGLQVGDVIEVRDGT